MEIKTLNEQIERLRELVRKCYATVAGKNGTVPEVGERNMENLPAAIGSIKSASEVPKVKVDSLKVTNNCINEEGRWEGETLIDTSVISNFSQLFDRNTLLRTINIEGWDFSNATDVSYLCRDCTELQSFIDLSRHNLTKVVRMGAMFTGCNKIKGIKLTDMELPNLNIMGYFIYNLYHLNKSPQDQYINILGLRVPALTNIDLAFFLNPDSSIIRDLVGNTSEEIIVRDNLFILGGLNINVPTKTFSEYNRATLRALINGLADRSNQESLTLTIGANNMSRLTDEDIVIATEKGWTIA